MAQLIPDSWKRVLVRLRDDMHHALTRWLPRWASRAQDDAQRVPVRWSDPFERVHDEMHSMLDRWLAPWRGEENEAWLPPAVFFGGGPLIDVEETDDEVMVRAELPGVDENDFTAELTADRLILRGEKRQEAEERRRGYYYAERSYGAFARAIALPCEVDADKATAKYKNGVLRVTLPKTAQAKAKRITVHVRG
jgi:HSP20 family protein